MAIDEKASAVEFVNEVGAEDQVVGNSDRLAQVFVNLLRNALNAVEAGAGRIVVRSRSGERAGEAGDRRSPWRITVREFRRMCCRIFSMRS